MRLAGFAVFDSAAKLYLPPFFTRSKGEAMRSFMDACNDDKHQFARHSTDYSLYFVGEFSEEDGVFVPVDNPERIMSALDAVRQS